MVRIDRRSAARIAREGLLPALMLAGCSDATPGASPFCDQIGWRLQCEHNGVSIETDTGRREVFWQVPEGEPPEGGWPVILFFQGAFVPAEKMWDASERAMFGMYDQVRAIEVLLDAGYAVITPTAPVKGLTTWTTNVPPWSGSWDGSPDDQFVDLILEGIDAGDFGLLDPGTLYAVGLSSGGYMSSRMALTYPGRFHALVIASGSYATCLGPVCDIPKELPEDHPPTRFLHGALDVFVPAFTMQSYRNKLEEQGIPTDAIVHPLLGHSWTDTAPEDILSWLEAYP